MKPNLYDEIVKLEAATRLQLAQDPLDSAASEAFPPLSRASSALKCGRASRIIGHPRRSCSSVDFRAKFVLEGIMSQVRGRHFPIAAAALFATPVTGMAPQQGRIWRVGNLSAHPQSSPAGARFASFGSR